MDLLNMLLDPIKLKSACFLCFKQDKDSLNVSNKLFIQGELETSCTTLSGIMKYLYPCHDILFSQACQACSGFLIKSYIMLRKHSMIKNILNKLMRILNKEIDFVSENMRTADLPKIARLQLPLKEISRKSFFNKQPVEVIEIQTNLKSENNTSAIKEKQYCKECDMSFTSKNFLNQHKKIAHQNSNRGVVCEICGKDCIKPSTLKVHLNCHKEKPCPYCSKTLKLHSHYKTHIKRHEGLIRKVSRKSVYYCHSCQYKSLNKNSLDAHINKTHLCTRPYVCEICYQGFYKKSNLTEHILIHKNPKNLTCEECGDNFATKKTLNEHLRLHSGEKPFQCEICSLKFVTAGRRSEHFKRKHMEKTICCFICDRKFSLKRELNSHIKKVHGHTKNGEEIALNQTNLFSELS